ncbi:hypothetical protein HPB52_000329 [Rhipicephalus sanguineus]|uniref:Uncharacterized protein n=1 Tax=Rhipicephalus sanguineus TaxID=34632 RepID=A0A9D4Q8C1_RHISA|nr:hypothetical protein HPB52_000329 [Rhipicephalus sanguineus]
MSPKLSRVPTAGREGGDCTVAPVRVVPEPAGERVTLADYCARMKEGQRDIYYLAAPSRQLAEDVPLLRGGAGTRR